MKKTPFELTKIGSSYFRLTHKLFAKRLHKKDSKRFINTDFSLICSNCLAGVFYNFYHLQFLSPTINTDFNGLGFLKFANNLKDLLQIDMVEGKRSGFNHPVGFLNDIGPIKFPHCDTFSEGKEQWNRRKERVNYNNIIVIWNAYKTASKEEIDLFDKIPYKKICYTIDPSLENHPNCVYLKRYQSQNSIPLLLTPRNFKGEEIFEYYFDMISYINGEEFSKCLRHKGR